MTPARAPAGGRPASLHNQGQKSESSRSVIIFSFHNGIRLREGLHLGSVSSPARKQQSISWSHNSSIALLCAVTLHKGSLQVATLKFNMVSSSNSSSCCFYFSMSSQLMRCQAVFFLTTRPIVAYWQSIRRLNDICTSLWSLGISGDVLTSHLCMSRNRLGDIQNDQYMKFYSENNTHKYYLARHFHDSLRSITRKISVPIST